jgi:hypothetical protein
MSKDHTIHHGAERLVCTKCYATTTQWSYDTAVSIDGVRASPNEKVYGKKKKNHGI